MPRVALFNMLIGFILILISAMAGTFIAQDLTQAYLNDPESQLAMLHNWQTTILKSAHGHINLFGMLHILFGLTIPYSILSKKIKIFQTLGFISASLSMSIGMLIKSQTGPQLDMGICDVLMGISFSLLFIAIAGHAFGIWCKMSRND